jgi:hypothetical protein
MTRGTVGGLVGVASATPGPQVARGAYTVGQEVAAVRWLGRKNSRPGATSGAQDRAARRADLEHLEQFVRTRRGVEAFVEPRTSVTAMTVILIAADGEWTRRRIGGPDDARKLGQRLAIPVYDVGAVGYPQRMRDWSRKNKPAEN